VKYFCNSDDGTSTGKAKYGAAAVAPFRKKKNRTSRRKRVTPAILSQEIQTEDTFQGGTAEQRRKLYRTPMSTLESLLRDIDTEIERSIKLEKEFQVAAENYLQRFDKEGQLASKTTDALNEIDTLKLKYNENMRLLSKKIEQYKNYYQKLSTEKEKLVNEIRELQQQQIAIRNERSRQRIAALKHKQYELELKISSRVKLCQLFLALTVFLYFVTIFLKFFVGKNVPAADIFA